jgi:hypothetical protein
MTLLHNTDATHVPAYGDWVCDCDECYNRLLESDQEFNLVIKASRGRICISREDFTYICTQETIDEFAERISLGNVREIFIADADTPIGRARRSA